MLAKGNENPNFICVTVESELAMERKGNLGENNPV